MRHRWLLCLPMGLLIASICGAEFQVNTHTANDQKSAGIAMDRSGNFVVVWSSYLQDGSSNGIFARRFDPNCSPLGEEIPINTITAGNQTEPAVAMDAAAGFVVAWQGPGLIDAGIDILNPVQISARGMDAARLKREFGDRLCFWGGGCDTQAVLPFGTPEEVVQHTREQIAIFKPGSGFVFCQVHNIQAGVPPQNIAAMRQALHDCW